MNRHKAYWSVMGNEPNNEPSALSLQRSKDKEELKKMIGRYNNDGFTEVCNLLREIKEGD